MDSNQLLAFVEANDVNDMYVLIRWPHVQELMKYYWFDPECYLYKSFGFQRSYFVPIGRILKIKEPG
jgi:hypothetical protein